MPSTKPATNKKVAQRLKRWGISLLIIGITSLSIGRVILRIENLDILGLFICIGGFPIMGLGIRKIILGKKLLQRSADEEIAGSDKPYVLYLRSFDEDEQLIEPTPIFASNITLPGSTHELKLAKVLKNIGPFVAIGKPGDVAPPLGAARVYVSDESWQQEFMRLVNGARLTIWFTGFSKGVIWELQQLVKIVDPQKLIIFLPLQGLSSADRTKYWSTFTDLSRPIFPRSLPPTVGQALFLRFDADWTAHLVESKTILMERIATPLWPKIERGLQCALSEMGIDYGAKPLWIRNFFYAGIISLTWLSIALSIGLYVHALRVISAYPGAVYILLILTALLAVPMIFVLVCAFRINR